MERESLNRLVLRGLPALLTIASTATLLAAVLAWGAASHVGIAAWATTAAGLGFAMPGLLTGLLVLRDVVRKTAGAFSIFHFQIVAGFAAILLAIGVETALALRIADPSTYDNLRDEDGSFNTTTAGFMFIAASGIIFAGIFIVLVSYLYAQSITLSPRTRQDRQPGERDGVGELLRGKPRDRLP